MSKDLKTQNILIIGIKGGLAQTLAGMLLESHPEVQILGIDCREPPEHLQTNRLEMQKIKYTRNNFEKLFRNNTFDYVYHLSRLSNALPKANIRERTDINVVGTNRILELARAYKVKKTIVLSTYYVYGASPENPLFIGESHPLRASFRYHELHDVVEMDQSTTSAMWRFREEMETVILRPCNIIGPHIRNAMSHYLTSTVVPVPIDYRPMFQFIYESDMARVLRDTMSKIPGGIFNVAPDDTISLERAKKLLGQPYTRAPLSLWAPLARLLPRPGKRQSYLPQYLFDYLKYSCVLDSREIKKHLGPDFCQFSSEEAILELSKSI